MNISIFASIGAKNLGDELILKNIVENFNPGVEVSKKLSIKSLISTPGLKSNMKFRVFSYDPKNPFFKANNIEYLEYFPIGIKNPINIFKNIYNFFIFIKTIVWSNLLVIGGGGIIYDTENQIVTNPLNQWIFRINIARFFKKDIVFYGVGIDIKDNSNYKKVKKIFSGAKEISVRDNNSQNILNNLGFKSQIILDPVFYDNNHKTPVGADLVSAQNPQNPQNPQNNQYTKIPIQNKNPQNIIPNIIQNCIRKIESNKFNLKDLKEIDFKNKKVGIAFRSGFFNSQSNKKVGNDLELLKIKEIIDYIIKSGGKVILLPHSFHKTDKLANDYEFLKKIKFEFRQNANLDITSSMQETYKYYKQKKLDICLAERLHSMILSEVYEIPFIGFIYGKKTRELLNNI